MTPLAQVSPDAINALSDAGVGVLALVALIVVGFGAWRLGDRLFATVDRLAVSAEGAREKAERALNGATAAQEALASAGQAIIRALEANTGELKAQTGMLAALTERVESSGRATTAALIDRLDAHDTLAQNGLKQLQGVLAETKEAVAALRSEVQAGHKLQRVEVEAKLGRLEGKVDDVLLLLNPPPPPPKIAPAPRPEPAEGEKAA